MITVLPYSKNISRFQKSLALILTIAIHTGLAAQFSGNLITNGSFESPAVSGVNSNHLIGAGLGWGGWDCTNGGFNILRVQGSGYTSGANHADDGDQYMDVNGTDGFITQTFILDHVSPLYFSGAFSSRESGRSGYVNWTATVEILDSNGAVVASSSTKNFTTTEDQEVWYTMTGTTANLLPGRYTYRAYAGNFGHFDNATVFALNPVLSVKLLNFNAVTKGTQVNLNWSVSTEQKLKGYELQASVDGVHFKAINFVPANNASQYSSNDKHPSNGTNYYRLRVVDLDGKFFFSGVAVVTADLNAATSLYPNPAREFFYLNVDKSMIRKQGNIVIANASGQVLLKKTLSKIGSVERIDIKGLLPGTYFVQILVDGYTIVKPLQVLAG